MPISPTIDAGPADIERKVRSALDRVAELFDRQLGSDLPNVGELCRQIGRYRGKMIRPRLVVVSGLAAAPELEDVLDEHITLATVCEIVHMATLVHDDVLDDARTRRRELTVNRLRGNEAAVMLGDYLIAAAYHLCSQSEHREAAVLVGRTAMVMCEGELLQLHHRDDYSLDVATYEEILARKTGALIGLACRLGALASRADTATADRLERFGLELGVAFQIQDDVLDLTSTEGTLGKPTGKDLDKAKLTLPLIHHLELAGADGRGDSLDLLERACAGDRSAAEQLLRAMDRTGSIEYARSEAARRVEHARTLIEPLVDSPAKRHLLLAADTLVNRDR